MLNPNSEFDLYGHPTAEAWNEVRQTATAFGIHWNNEDAYPDLKKKVEQARNGAKAIHVVPLHVGQIVAVPQGSIIVFYDPTKPLDISSLI